LLKFALAKSIHVFSSSPAGRHSEVKLVTNGTLKWRWYWVTEILEQDGDGI
jgi:hypothetical protein